MSLQQFKAKFSELIATPTLGEPQGYQQRSDKKRQSPASKELSKTKLLEVLKGNEFCGMVYRLSQAYRRLERERVRVPQVSTRLRPAIQRYRTSARYLKHCAQMLAGCDKKCYDLIDFKSMQELNSAQDLLQVLANKFEQRSTVLVSNIHPKNRRKHHSPSDWDLLFNLYDYPLKTLCRKAPDQWFVIKVSFVLHEFIKRKNLPKISDLTKFKVISVICSAAINLNVGHSAIKQFFFEHQVEQVRNL